MLPYEVIGNIIIESGNISLLCKISSLFKQMYSSQIIHYYTTLPITINEFNKYKPNVHWLFVIEDRLLAWKYEYNFTRATYHATCLVDGNKKFSNQPFSPNYINNYDINTIYNIITNHQNFKIYAKKTCLDTFNHYCEILTGKSLILYLYINVIMLDKEWTNKYNNGLPISENDIINTDLNRINLIKNCITSYINNLHVKDEFTGEENVKMLTKFIIKPV